MAQSVIAEKEQRILDMQTELDEQIARTLSEVAIIIINTVL